METTVMETTVYAAPVQQPSLSPEDIRKKYINHEASVKSIGVLYYIGAILTVIAGAVGLLAPKHDEIPPATIMLNIAFSILFIGIGVFQFCVGRGLQKLRQWARIPTIILSSIGLLGFPLGTVINGYFLYLVVCEKGKTVFSDEYKAVIQATPHIRYKTSIIVWIFLALFILLLGIGLIAAMMGK